MVRLFYTLLLYLATPFILARLLWRAHRAPAYARRWSERFGFVRTVDRQGRESGSISDRQKKIWVHCVSVGETLAAVPLIKALQEKYPTAALVVTTTTPTGSEQVSKIFGDSVHHVYAPYDLPDALGRFFARIKPSLLIIMETELWPNLIYQCRRRHVPVVIANARLSEKSAAGYRKAAWLSQPMMNDITLVAAQAEADGDRFRSLGLTEDKLVVTGNIKFDLRLDSALCNKANTLKGQWRSEGSRWVLLAASTHQGEDELILDAFAEVIESLPKVLLVLVPRHPERFDDVAVLCANRGFSLSRRSHQIPPALTTQILLGDTMGELLAFFGASDIAFVGGSLVPVGGHNLIEPAAWGIPVLSGPHLFNFAEVSTKLEAAGGMEVCGNAEQLAKSIVRLLEDSNEYSLMADAAHSVADSNRGALDRLVKSLSEWLE